MTLDLSSVSFQIKQMRESLKNNNADAASRLETAVAALFRHAPNYAELRDKIDRSRTYWPVARPQEPLDARHSLPVSFAQGGEYTVIATDGSQIEPDRHRAALCYLLNIGIVLLRYGPQSRAELRSIPILAFGDDELYIVSNYRRFLVQGHILTVKRSIAETSALADAAELAISASGAASGGTPLLGLQDGTLILQTLEGQGIEDRLRDQLIGDYLARLERLRQLGVPLASYISRPRASDVANALRVAECSYPIANCGQNCRELLATDAEPCAWLSAIPDRALFGALLQAEGERSGLFLSSSAISLERYDEHRVHFFYLNVGREIARVEVPEWVARDSSHLDLVQAAIYDQCRRGDGYPRSLAEAHEKAVVTGADRATFWRLVDTALVGEHLPASLSQKERSKRIRGL